MGFIQAGTENASECRDFLNGLHDRGLKVEEGVLCGMAVKGSGRQQKRSLEDMPLFRGVSGIRENLVGYLPKVRRAAFRELLQKAYEEPTHEGAKKALKRVKKELSLINELPVRSLEEGLEQTLTLRRLGVFEKLGKSFKTTNCIECIMALIGQKTDKVDYWRNSNQKQRWLVTALLDIEPRLDRVKGYNYRPELRVAIQRSLG